jgi:hypothetical protein
VFAALDDARTRDQDQGRLAQYDLVGDGDFAKTRRNRPGHCGQLLIVRRFPNRGSADPRWP